MLLSVVIPAHDEAGHIGDTVRDLSRTLGEEGIAHEIVVVNDHSSDGTGALVESLSEEIPELRLVTNYASGGFGMAVRAGLEAFSGDSVAIYMADGSDSPRDLVMFLRAMEVHGVDCVFGTRFSAGGRVYDYPRFKLLLNRAANLVVRLLFALRYDDVTNAFKLYRRDVIDGVAPLLSNHFNLTVELPLKAVVRGYSFTVVPNSWINRAHGTSKFQIQEMGSRYAFIVLYCFLERWLSRGDYHRRRETQVTTPAPAGDDEGA